MQCPRCNGPLDPATLEGVPLHRCATCEGVAVAQPKLIPLLRGLESVVSALVDVDAAVPPVADPPGPAACPVCRQRMENFGYMGTSVVFLDRCSRDALIWVDGEELPTLGVLYARTQRRTDARRAFYEEEFTGMDRRMARGRVMRAVANAMILGGL